MDDGHVDSDVVFLVKNRRDTQRLKYYILKGARSHNDTFFLVIKQISFTKCHFSAAFVVNTGLKSF